MEWIKIILEKSAVMEDGKPDVEAILKVIAAEFPKHAVPKKDFNNKVMKLNAANETIRELEAAVLHLKKEYALKESLKERGALDADYIIYRQGGITQFSFDEKGRPIGMEELAVQWKMAAPYLFQKRKVDYKAYGGNIEKE